MPVPLSSARELLASPSPGYRVWVPNYGANTISVLNPDGTQAKNADGTTFAPPATIGGQTLNHPVGICSVGTQVWVSSNSSKFIFIYDAATGAGITTFSTGGTGTPTGIWRVDDNEVWVGVNDVNTLKLYDARGNGGYVQPNILRLASTPSVPDHGVVLPNGEIWICSVAATGTIKRYSHTGALLSTITIGNFPTMLCVVGNQVWLISNGDGNIYRYDFAANALSTITTGLSNIRGACVVGSAVWVTYGAAGGSSIAAYLFDGTATTIPGPLPALSSPYHICTAPTAPRALPPALSIISQVAVTADAGSVLNFEAGIVQCADSPTHLLIVCSEYSSAAVLDGRIWTASSTNAGATWSAKTYIVARLAGHGWNFGCFGILTQGAHAGRIVLAYFDYNGSTGTTIYTMYSDDHGVTWSAPAAMTPFTAGGGSLLQAVEGTILQLSNGTVLLPIYGNNSGDTHNRAALLTSTDGATWGNFTTIAAPGVSVGYNECSFIEELDGTVTAYLRGDPDSSNAYYVCTSSDHGVTWSAPTLLPWTTTQPGTPCVMQFPNSGMRLACYRAAPTGAAAAYSASLGRGQSWPLPPRQFTQSGAAALFYSVFGVPNGTPGQLALAACYGGSPGQVYCLTMQANG